MKKVAETKILENRKIARTVYSLTVEWREMSQNIFPGQFLELYVDKSEHLLPRPIAICENDVDQGTIRMVYEVVGKGTEYFSTLKANDRIKLLAPVGNGYEAAEGDRHLLVGGSVGNAPLLDLARVLRARNPKAAITAVMGFSSETYLVEDFKKYGCEVEICTDDGSSGFKGNVIELINSLDKKWDHIYSCGPLMMLKAVSKWAKENNTPAQISLDERMACGVGACVGCVVKIKTVDGWDYKKVCKDGPVFKSDEVIWDE